jgi:Ser/Thr protein kinase RdoA (MazF antagonist)
MTGPAAAFGFDPPDASTDEVLRIAADHWGVGGVPVRLRGERSHNTRITTPGGAVRILQIQSASEDPAAIDLQTEAMRHVERAAPDLPVSRVVPTIDGATHAEVRLGSSLHLVRLVTHLPGTTFDGAGPLPLAAYRRIGDLVGRVAVALTDFDHPAAEHFMPWDLANGLVVDPDLRTGLSPEGRSVIDSVDDRLHSAVATMAGLPGRTIHNDGHAGNLLRPDGNSDVVTGLIDFGDLVRTVAAADVAIIAESFAPDHPDPAGVLGAAAAGYHRHVSLSSAEIDALEGLVLVRAALSVLLAEFQIRHAPHLADAAAANLPEVIDRLRRWSTLDASAVTSTVTDAIESAAADDDPERPR